MTVRLKRTPEVAAALERRREVVKRRLPEFLRAGVRLTEGCRQLRVARDTVARWRLEDGDFDLQLAEAETEWLGKLEAEVHERAFDRRDRESGRLLMFATKHADPSYRDMYQGTQARQYVNIFANLPMEQLDRLLELAVQKGDDGGTSTDTDAIEG